MPYLQTAISQDDGDIAVLGLVAYDRTIRDFLWPGPRAPDSSHLPVSIESGHEITVNYLIRNDSADELYLFQYIAIVDPNGVIVADSWSPGGQCAAKLSPGSEFGHYNEVSAVLDIEGLWVVRGEVQYEQSGFCRQ
jgi:hypothetical protein